MYQIQLNEFKYKRSSEISTLFAENDLAFETVDTLYLPGFLPDGYELSNQLGSPHKNSNILTIYTNGEYDIFFQQLAKSTSSHLDNEDISSSKILVHESEGILREDSGELVLMWADEIYIYYLKSNQSAFSKNTLLKIAESIKEVPSNESN